MKTTTITLPSAWASYLINGDNSGLTRLEQDRADKETEGLNIVGIVEDSKRFTWWYALYDPESGFKGGTVADYIIVDE